MHARFAEIVDLIATEELRPLVHHQRQDDGAEDAQGAARPQCAGLYLD
jgi:hypothetical protein